MSNSKYRVRDVAKDLDVKGNVISEIVEKNFDGVKASSMTALEDDQLDVVFDTVTKENQASSFDISIYIGEKIIYVRGVFNRKSPKKAGG